MSGLDAPDLQQKDLGLGPVFGVLAWSVWTSLCTGCYIGVRRSSLVGTQTRTEGSREVEEGDIGFPNHCNSAFFIVI